MYKLERSLRTDRSCVITYIQLKKIKFVQNNCIFNNALHTRLPRHRGHYVQIDVFIKSFLRRPPDAEDEHTTPVYYSHTMQNPLPFFYHNIYLPQTHTSVSYTHLDVYKRQVEYIR